MFLMCCAVRVSVYFPLPVAVVKLLLGLEVHGNRRVIFHHLEGRGEE